MASKSIFLDLEINVELMMESPKEFEREVHRAADKLVDILDQSNSIGESRKVAYNRALANKEAKKVANNLFNSEFTTMQEWAETADMDQLYYAIQALKDVARDMELTFDSRASSEMIMSQSSATDKRLAAEQYRQLREAFETYRSFVNLMIDEDITIVPLKAKTGNYGGQNQHTYPAYKLNGEVYHNYRAVARMLGIKDEVFNHMDLQERITEDMPVEIVEIRI